MTLFFISSPGQMAHRALSVLEEKKPENLTIVTTDAIRPFLEGRVKAKIITLKTEPNLITRSSKSKIVSNAIRSKLEYRRLFKDIENEDVYLFFTSWGVVPISYVKKLSKRNKVYLYPESFLNDMYEEEKSFVATGMKLAVKLLLGLDVYIVRWNNIPVWELRPNSFPMEIVEYDGFNAKLPKQFMMDTDLLKGKRVLFLGSKFEIDCEESEDKVKLTDELMDIFEKNFKGEYVIKAHPIDKVLYGRMKDSKFVIPSYVCLLYTSPSPRDRQRSRMPSSA